MRQIRNILKLPVVFALLALHVGTIFSANANFLSSVEMNNGKTRVQYRIDAENNINFKSFHNLLLKAGYEINKNSKLGVSTHFEHEPLKIETFLYNDGRLVVSISVEGAGSSYFGNSVTSLQGDLVYPLFDLVTTFGEEVILNSGDVAYDFEKLRCFPRHIKDGDVHEINCTVFI